jgi:hypothetical protein
MLKIPTQSWRAWRSWLAACRTKTAGLESPANRQPGKAALRARSVSVLATLLSVNLLASPAQHPKRLINSYQVDLSPLFKWWAKHEGPRPLASWVHITGSIVGTNAVGWILEAQVEGADKAEGSTRAAGHDPLKIILRTPPVEDLADFQSLSSKLAALNAQRTTLTTEETQDKEREQAVAAQQRGARGNRARMLSLEDRQLKQAENQAKAGQKPLDQQIQEIKSKLASYGSTDRYAVDCFALDLQSDYEKMPVYDHGRIMK